MKKSLFEQLRDEGHDVKPTFCRGPDGSCTSCGMQERQHTWRCGTCGGAFAMDAEGLPITFGTAIAHTKCQGTSFLYCERAS